MDEVAFQEEVVAVLKKSLEGADVSRTTWNYSSSTSDETFYIALVIVLIWSSSLYLK